MKGNSSADNSDSQNLIQLCSKLVQLSNATLVFKSNSNYELHNQFCQINSHTFFLIPILFKVRKTCFQKVQILFLVLLHLLQNMPVDANSGILRLTSFATQNGATLSEKTSPSSEVQRLSKLIISSG